MVGNGDQIFAVVGHGEAQIAVGAAAVVVAGERRRRRPMMTDQRIQRRAERAGEDAHVEHLPLLGGELEEVDVAGLGDHAVDGHRHGERRGRRRLIVRLDFEHVAEIDQAKRIGRGGITVLVVGEQAKVGQCGRSAT